MASLSLCAAQHKSPQQHEPSLSGSAVNQTNSISTSPSNHLTFVSGLVAGLTVPLVLSYASPAPGPAGDAQRGFRRATYLALAGPEVAFVAIMGGAWFKGADVGMTETALLGGAINMTAFLVLRSVFLFWKPHLLEERDDKKTA